MGLVLLYSHVSLVQFLLRLLLIQKDKSSNDPKDRFSISTVRGQINETNI